MFRRRQSYVYFNKWGTRVFVPAGWQWYKSKGKDPKVRFKHACPECGALIETVRNPKGGWAHFEPGMIHLGTLHPCFTRGRDLSKKRPADMDDLFQTNHHPHPKKPEF